MDTQFWTQIATSLGAAGAAAAGAFFSLGSRLTRLDEGMKALRTEMQKEINAVRGEIGTLSADVKSRDEAAKNSIATLRSELRSDIAQVRTEVAALSREVSEVKGEAKMVQYYTRRSPRKVKG